MEYSFTSHIRVRRIRLRNRTYSSFYILIPMHVIKAYGIPISELINREVKVTVVIEDKQEPSQQQHTGKAP